ncbi:MAG TPA: c-type cytochrome [Thermoanaerobaculia bacterium]|nr:c-type cytochrome [Thermoanaerobaculia bacterium]
MRRLAALTALLVLGCAAMQQQKAQPPATDDLHFRNLHVLPPNISRDDLLLTMRRFTQALGVGCDYCHAPLPAMPGEEPELDFPSDAKREKDSARTMIRMTRRINQDFISRIPDAHTVVTCWTCHRGEVQPAIVPSLPAQPAR